jgi:hypothetical protein
MARAATCQKTAPSPATVTPMTVAERTGLFRLDPAEESEELPVELSVEFLELSSEDWLFVDPDDSRDDSPEAWDDSPESSEELAEPSDEFPDPSDEPPDPSDEPPASDEPPESESEPPESEPPESEPPESEPPESEPPESEPPPPVVTKAPEFSVIPNRPGRAAPGVWHPASTSQIPTHAVLFHGAFVVIGLSRHCREGDTVDPEDARRGRLRPYGSASCRP